MAMGKRERQEQDLLWVSHKRLPRSQGHHYYEVLNQILNHLGFDEWVQLGRNLPTQRVFSKAIPVAIATPASPGSVLKMGGA